MNFKKHSNLGRRRYYLSLYRRLFMLYTRQGYDANSAGLNAALAFENLTGIEYREFIQALR